MKPIKTCSATLLVVLLMTMTGCPPPYDASDHPLFARGPYIPGPIVPREGECWKLENLSTSYNFGGLICQVGSETHKLELRRANLLFPSHRNPLPDTVSAEELLLHCEAKAMNLLESCKKQMDILMGNYSADPACKAEINRQREGCLAEFEDGKKRCQYECNYVKKKALEAKSNPQG